MKVYNPGEKGGLYINKFPANLESRGYAKLAVVVEFENGVIEATPTPTSNGKARPRATLKQV